MFSFDVFSSHCVFSFSFRICFRNQSAFAEGSHDMILPLESARCLRYIFFSQFTDLHLDTQPHGLRRDARGRKAVGACRLNVEQKNAQLILDCQSVTFLETRSLTTSLFRIVDVFLRISFKTSRWGGGMCGVSVGGASIWPLTFP